METWKDIEGYEGLYQVSDHGRVKSLARTIPRRGGNPLPLKERIRKTAVNGSGYYTTSLCKNGECSTKRIHTLVAIAFLGHTLCGMKEIIDHIDGDKLNNHVSNLQLVSNRENVVKGKVSTGLVGASYHKRDDNWKSQIRIKGKQTHLGYFATEQEAHDRYMQELLAIS